MSWVATLILCVLVVEIVMRLPFRPLLDRARRTSGRAFWTMRAKLVSDHWKEKAMVAYSGHMFACSFRLAGLLVVVAVIVVLFVLAANFIIPGYARFIAGWWGILASVVAAGLYLSIRKHLPHARLRSARQTAAPAGTATRPGGRAQL